MHSFTIDKAGLERRLKRIEGQVRGVGAMVENDRYCIDIITQLRAARAALSAVESELLKGHISHCVKTAAMSDDEIDVDAKLAELIKLLPYAAGV
ncbi:MAG: transcriptional regulator [Sphingomonadales bacterium 28-64-96]|nr:MAG: transcriptional regulator [Sphingomonadales bacterium 28-64-96]